MASYMIHLPSLLSLTILGGIQLVPSLDIAGKKQMAADEKGGSSRGWNGRV